MLGGKAQAVLDDAMGKEIFQVPAGKYYLGDTGYVSSDTVLSPYRGYRYHVKEAIEAEAKPACMQELFNLRHAELRNEVERVFGVAKRRFPILGRAYETLDMDTQVKLVYALTGLHNFIRQNATHYDTWDTEGIEKGEMEARRNAGLSNRDPLPSTPQRCSMEEFRDTIAAAMWKDYCEYIGISQ
jgi:DDE superfamily endonuclease